MQQVWLGIESIAIEVARHHHVGSCQPCPTPPGDPFTFALCERPCLTALLISGCKQNRKQAMYRVEIRCVQAGNVYNRTRYQTPGPAPEGRPMSGRENPAHVNRPARRADSSRQDKQEQSE